MKLHFSASKKPRAQENLKVLVERYGQHSEAESDAIVALGGDGHMLKTLQSASKSGKPVFGINCGKVGFLMNPLSDEDLIERIKSADETVIHPLEMRATDCQGKTTTAHAINEISMHRESSQAAQISISVDDKIKLEQLVCDGILLATPAGSTAYNFSAHGPIIPLGSAVLALTPISAFRPRRWRGALLPDYSVVEFRVQDPDLRSVSASADASTSIACVEKVIVRQDSNICLRLLSDPGHNLEEKAMNEQFLI